jgi:hypothetical protein
MRLARSTLSTWLAILIISPGLRRDCQFSDPLESHGLRRQGGQAAPPEGGRRAGRRRWVARPTRIWMEKASGEARCQGTSQSASPRWLSVLVVYLQLGIPVLDRIDEGKLRLHGTSTSEAVEALVSRAPSFTDNLPGALTIGACLLERRLAALITARSLPKPLRLRSSSMEF